MCLLDGSMCQYGEEQGDQRDSVADGGENTKFLGHCNSFSAEEESKICEMIARTRDLVVYYALHPTACTVPVPVSSIHFRRLFFNWTQEKMNIV